MTLDTARILGGIGAILGILSILHSALGIVGIVLILIALKMISDEYGMPQIFKYALYSTIIIVIAIAIILAMPYSVMGLVLHSFTTGASSETPAMTFVGGIVAAVVAAWILTIVGMYFLRRSLMLTSQATGQGLFKTAGLLYLIGAGLLIVLVGGVLVLIAHILLAIAFFSMKITK